MPDTETPIAGARALEEPESAAPRRISRNRGSAKVGAGGGRSRRRGARARSRRGCQSQAFWSPMWWRSHAPKAGISPAALLRGYASATERPKGRQCAKAARALEIGGHMDGQGGLPGAALLG